MGTVDRRPLGYTAGHIAVPGTRVVFTATFALMILDLADRQVVVATFPQLQAEWGLSDTQLGARVGHRGARRLPGRPARGPVEPGTGDRGHGHGLEPCRPPRRARRRAMVSSSRPAPLWAPARPATVRLPGHSWRRGSRLPGERPSSERSSQRRLWRDAGCGPRRCGRGAVGVARGVLGPRAPRAGRGPVVPPLPGLSDGAAGRRDRRPLGAARGARAVSVPVWVSRIRGRGCPAGGGIDDLHVAPQPAAPRLRYAGRPGVWPPRWSSSPGSPA